MKALRKPLSLFMAMLMCLGIFAGTGTTAFAAGETMTTYMVEFPRASDPNKAGWGHSAMNFLGGWSTGENNGFTIHTQDSFNGKVIYCIEPGVSVHSGDQFTGRGEDFWDDYPSDLNPTIPPDTIKESLPRLVTPRCSFSPSPRRRWWRSPALPFPTSGRCCASRTRCWQTGIKSAAAGWWRNC